MAAAFSDDGSGSAALSLGALPLKHSDLGFQITGFDYIPVRFLFWEGDDEFPAQANILFNDNTPDFIHIESVVTIAIEGLRQLARTAGIPLLVRSFEMT